MFRHLNYVAITYLQREIENSPASLRRPDVALAFVYLRLILVVPDHHINTVLLVGLHCDSGLVTALVHVLVQVLDGLDGGAELHVDVGPELEQQPGVVGHHASVVHYHMLSRATDSHRCGVASSTLSWTRTATTVGGVAVVTDAGPLAEGLGEALGALAVFHAGALGVVCTTRSMEHEPGSHKISVSKLN